MKSIMRTAYGAAVQTHLYTGIPFVVQPHTTLNEKLNILATQRPTSTVFPQLKYFCIGNGGHRPEVINGMSKFVKVQHTPTNASPFKMIPFVLREPGNDLTATERARYALRREETYNGTRYIAYYLRRLDYSKRKVTMELVEALENGTVTSTPFVPNSSNLNPTPQPIHPTGVSLVTGESIQTTTTVEMEFTEKDCEELRNVGNIMYADEDLGAISEVGLVSGVDRSITVNNPNGSFTFNEVIAAQVCHLNNTYHTPTISDMGFTIRVAIGSSEPLYHLTNSRT